VADVEVVLDKLKKVRQSGANYLAVCPAHEDDKPSLSIREREGVILVKCFAGCSFDSIRKALGLAVSSFFPDGSAPSNGKRRVDRRGQELEAMSAIQVLQGDQRVLDALLAARGWTADALSRLWVGWNAGRKRLTLPVYDKDGKLHDILLYAPKLKPKMLQGKGKSRQPWPSPERVDYVGSRWTFLVEGEGTAISLASLGFPAISLPGSVARASGDVLRPSSFGGNGWHKSWKRRFTRFPRIICIPDCDGPGRSLMMTAEYDLRSEGVRCNTVDLDPARQDGFDVGDWARPFRTDRQRELAREMLSMLVRTATRQPDQIGEARELFHGYSLSEGGGTPSSSQPAVTEGRAIAGTAPTPPPSESEWSWAA
jgi:hypothetical protein